MRLREAPLVPQTLIPTTTRTSLLYQSFYVRPEITLTLCFDAFGVALILVKSLCWRPITLYQQFLPALLLLAKLNLLLVLHLSADFLYLRTLALRAPRVAFRTTSQKSAPSRFSTTQQQPSQVQSDAHSKPRRLPRTSRSVKMPPIRTKSAAASTSASFAGTGYTLLSIFTDDNVESLGGKLSEHGHLESRTW